MNIEVTSVTRSPMNPHQWLLGLVCGHDKWVTCKSRPTRKTQYCADCAIAKKATVQPDQEKNDG